MVATTASAPRVDNATTVNAQQTNAMTGMAEKRIMSAENVCPRQRAQVARRTHGQDRMLLRERLEAIARLVKPLRSSALRERCAIIAWTPTYSLRRCSSVLRASLSSWPKLVSLASESPMAVERAALGS